MGTIDEIRPRSLNTSTIDNRNKTFDESRKSNMNKSLAAERMAGNKSFVQ